MLDNARVAKKVSAMALVGAKLDVTDAAGKLDKDEEAKGLIGIAGNVLVAAAGVGAAAVNDVAAEGCGSGDEAARTLEVAATRELTAAGTCAPAAPAGYGGCREALPEDDDNDEPVKVKSAPPKVDADEGAAEKVGCWLVWRAGNDDSGAEVAWWVGPPSRADAVVGRVAENERGAAAGVAG